MIGFVAGVIVGLMVSVAVALIGERAAPTDAAMIARGYKRCPLCREGDTGTPGWIHDISHQRGQE